MSQVPRSGNGVVSPVMIVARIDVFNFLGLEIEILSQSWSHAYQWSKWPEAHSGEEERQKLSMTRDLHS